MLHLTRLQNVLVKIWKSICPNWKIYLSKLENAFVQAAKCISPSCKIYLIMAMIRMTSRCGTKKAVVLPIECKATPSIVPQLTISAFLPRRKCNAAKKSNTESVHCREEGCIGKYTPRGLRDFPRAGILHPETREIARGRSPRAISRVEGCKIPARGKSRGPRGVYFPIHPD